MLELLGRGGDVVSKCLQVRKRASKAASKAASKSASKSAGKASRSGAKGSGRKSRRAVLAEVTPAKDGADGASNANATAAAAHGSVGKVHSEAGTDSEAPDTPLSIGGWDTDDSEYS